MSTHSINYIFSCISIVLISAAGLVSAADGASSDLIAGSVAGVTSGSTFKFESNGTSQAQAIRLWGITTPDDSETYGEASMRALERAMAAESITLEPTGHGPDGQTIARVWVDGRAVNYWMIASGNAWVDISTNSDPRYMAAQHRAQNQRWGLWARQKRWGTAPSD